MYCGSCAAHQRLRFADCDVQYLKSGFDRLRATESQAYAHQETAS